MDNQEPNFYELLGINPEASIEEIRWAYRMLAGAFHPDRNPGDKESDAMFKRISQAYETVSDAGERKAYDLFLKTRRCQSTLDVMVENFEPLVGIFVDTMGIFASPLPHGKRSSCKTCNGSGRIPIKLGLIELIRSCSDCEA